MTGPHTDATSTGPNGQDEGTDFAFNPEELVDWIEGLVSMLESVDRSQNQYWCAQWWNHPEAVDRFRALYEQWLGAQANGGMSSWWIDHFDRHATILFGRRGPFGECGTQHVEKGTRRSLVTELPPSGWAW